jgi:hypothetical protein
MTDRLNHGEHFTPGGNNKLVSGGEFQYILLLKNFRARNNEGKEFSIL